MHENRDLSLVVVRLLQQKRNPNKATTLVSKFNWLEKKKKQLKITVTKNANTWESRNGKEREILFLANDTDSSTVW